jgi:hypothetical protein
MSSCGAHCAPACPGAFALALLLLAGCTATLQDQGAGKDGEFLSVPRRDRFPHVENAMLPSCGTLDCHGQISRNLRLFGLHGLRLRPTDNPLDGTTTREEYDASYWSIVGLEPEVISRVVLENGARPERLTMVRKARGIEKHKGGQIMSEGDALDRCIVGWLGGADSLADCDAVADVPRPEPNTGGL